jgi:hypothetical protein
VTTKDSTSAAAGDKAAVPIQPRKKKMTAIVAGQGLGLTNTSLGLLGGQGQLGTAAQGRSGEKVAVNASNGNLVVQQQDEWLVGVGLDVGLLRTYNSQATEDGDNGDNWRLGFSRKVIGTYSGTANSTVQRVDEDGSTTTYLWDASLSAYVNKSGGGSFDTLKWNSTLSQWSWTDGNTQVTEVYEGSGTASLKTVTDLDGKSLTLHYISTGSASGLIDRITDSNGEYVAIEYGGTAGNHADQHQITDTEYNGLGLATHNIERGRAAADDRLSLIGYGANGFVA